MKHSKKSIVAKLPWYELDRLILTTIGPHEWTPTRTIIQRVRKQCGYAIPADEISQRITEMIALGTVWSGGDLSLWRKYQSALAMGIDQ